MAASVEQRKNSHAVIYSIIFVLSYIYAVGGTTTKSTTELDRGVDKLVNSYRERDHWYYSSSSKLNRDEVENSWEALKDVEKLDFNRDGLRLPHNLKWVTLPFEFPFYGSKIKDIYIMENGFISFEYQQKEWTEESYYIAPFMAQFVNTEKSSVKYLSRGKYVTVQWASMQLNTFDANKGKPMFVGNIAFEATLTKGGGIIFSYRNVPNLNVYRPITRYQVGISNINASVPASLKAKQSIDLTKSYRIKNGTVISLVPKSSCSSMTSCKKCVRFNGSANNKYFCGWCPHLKTCSDGFEVAGADCKQSVVTEKESCV